MIDPDPLNRVAELPITIPRRPSVAADPGAQTIVPTYALESIQERRSSGLNAIDVILALIASGATFVEKTGCDNGTPYTYWAPEWTADPTP